ncbi:hypothetical protein BDF19DRAFT_415952 [Syncephalis fuscata]|nr:hypothetical protein BDF19DRAFT_415952 [Syncephalis fuscata]
MAAVKPSTDKADNDAASSILTLVEGEELVYCDRFVRLTTEYLILKNCYFPGVSYKIPLREIISVDGAQDIGVPCWQRKAMGIGLNLGIWWTLDFRRDIPGIKHFYPVIVKVNKKCQRKGFSIEDPKKFMPFIRQAIEDVRLQKIA